MYSTHIINKPEEGLCIVTTNTPRLKHGTHALYIHLADTKWSLALSGSAEFVRWVTENNWLFQIVNNRGFHALMKTGRPECYIPSAETLSCDIKNVFVHVHGCITKALQVRYTILIWWLRDSTSPIELWWQAQLCHWCLVITQPQVICCDHHPPWACRPTILSAPWSCQGSRVAYRCESGHCICECPENLWCGRKGKIIE